VWLTSILAQTNGSPSSSVKICISHRERYGPA
jgi:hypothetical protein